jgi:hypothetical protein
MACLNNTLKVGYHFSGNHSSIIKVSYDVVGKQICYQNEEQFLPIPVSKAGQTLKNVSPSFLI